MKTLPLATALLLAATLSLPALAQQGQAAAGPVQQRSSSPAAALDDAPELPGRRNQRIEHINHRDSGSTVDELRVGGETQNITVKPAYNAPAYQVVPEKGMPDANSGKRMWNVLKF